MSKIPISLELLTSEFARNTSSRAMELMDKDFKAYLDSYPQLLQKLNPSAVEDYVKEKKDRHSVIQLHNRLVQSKNKPSPLTEIKGKAAKKAAKKSFRKKK